MHGEPRQTYDDAATSPGDSLAPGRPPSRLRRAGQSVGRVLAGGAITIAGILGGALTYGLGERWLDPDDRGSLAGAVAVAIWFTAGLGGWLTPRKWPRLLVVFSLAGAVGWLFFATVQRWIP